MPTGKYVALTNYVEVDGSDLSDDCRAFTPASEFSLVDASGFNAGGNDENLVGPLATSATATFYDTAAVHSVLAYALQNRAIVPLVYRKDMNAGVGVNNPQFSGNVYVRTFSPGVTRGDVATYDVEFIAADAAGLTWSYS